jgi:hypothetical protein
MQANSAALEAGPVNPQPFSVGMSLQPQVDPLEWLPPAAAERLRMLRQRSADAHAVIPEFETVRQASMDKITAQNALKRLTDHPQDFGAGLDPSDLRCVAAAKLLAIETDKFERLKSLQERRATQWQAASAALAACETWLKSGRPGGTTLEDAEEVQPQLVKGESLFDGVERLRHRGRELKADIHRVRSACYTKAEAMALVSATVENWGSNGIDTSAAIEHIAADDPDKNCSSDGTQRAERARRCGVCRSARRGRDFIDRPKRAVHGVAHGGR